MCISVDLPEPDGPMTAVRRPSAMSTRDAAQGVDGGVALAVAADDVARGDDGVRGDERARAGGRRSAWRGGSSVRGLHGPSRPGAAASRLPASAGAQVRLAGARGRGQARRNASTASTRRWSSPSRQAELVEDGVTCFCTARSLIASRSAIALVRAALRHQPRAPRARGGERASGSSSRVRAEQLRHDRRVERRAALRDPLRASPRSPRGRRRGP